ncbi:hypothetical protein ACH5RR_041575 [Cinchona calisaya]|uniref:F-box domain-containing protein n=1 Tax=Cinchona calisaya TaxID=153742 RepID=A0ABD2XZD6_9GENT
MIPPRRHPMKKDDAGRPETIWSLAQIRNHSDMMDVCGGFVPIPCIGWKLANVGLRIAELHIYHDHAYLKDMLELIAQHVTKIEDFVAFGAVCTSWRSAASASKKNFKGLKLWQKIPCLILWSEDDDREFYSLMEREVVAKGAEVQLHHQGEYLQMAL